MSPPASRFGAACESIPHCYRAPYSTYFTNLFIEASWPLERDKVFATWLALQKDESCDGCGGRGRGAWRGVVSYSTEVQPISVRIALARGLHSYPN